MRKILLGFFLTFFVASPVKAYDPFWWVPTGSGDFTDSQLQQINCSTFLEDSTDKLKKLDESIFYAYNGAKNTSSVYKEITDEVSYITVDDWLFDNIELQKKIVKKLRSSCGSSIKQVNFIHNYTGKYKTYLFKK